MISEPTAISVRSATPDDVQILKQVYWRAKAAHGYSEREMADFAAEVDETLTVEALAEHAFAIAECYGTAVGFAGVMVNGEHDALHMEFLFVDPSAQGFGVGRMLFQWAVVEAERRGYAVLEFQSDTNVTGFYERMGAIKVSETPSTVIPGRMIPSYRFRVDQTNQGGR